MFSDKNTFTKILLNVIGTRKKKWQWNSLVVFIFLKGRDNILARRRCRLNPFLGKVFIYREEYG